MIKKEVKSVTFEPFQVTMQARKTNLKVTQN